MKATSLYYGSRPVLGMGWCLWAPRSGRCALLPENGTTALRRDERSEAIAGRAARNAFRSPDAWPDGGDSLLWFRGTGPGTDRAAGFPVGRGRVDPLRHRRLAAKPKLRFGER